MKKRENTKTPEFHFTYFNLKVNHHLKNIAYVKNKNPFN